MNTIELIPHNSTIRPSLTFTLNDLLWDARCRPFSEYYCKIHWVYHSDGTWASRSFNSPAFDCLFNCLFKLTTMQTSKLRVSDPLWWKSTNESDGFTLQRATNSEIAICHDVNVSRHHLIKANSVALCMRFPSRPLTSMNYLHGRNRNCHYVMQYSQVICTNLSPCLSRMASMI